MLVVLENVIVVFNSVKRHLVETRLATSKNESGRDGDWTGEDEVFGELHLKGSD